MPDQPFWSDNFDMDLPKIFPDARKLLGDLADVELTTSGRADERTGRLNHPSVWNTDNGPTAFFGLRGRSPGRDTRFYVAPGSGEICCTAWEAFRDCWAHSYVMVIDQRPVWDTADLWPSFETIMWDVRGWGNPRHSPRLSRLRAMASYAEAVRRFGRIMNDRRSALSPVHKPAADGGANNGQ